MTYVASAGQPQTSTSFFFLNLFFSACRSFKLKPPMAIIEALDCFHSFSLSFRSAFYTCRAAGRTEISIPLWFPASSTASNDLTRWGAGGYFKNTITLQAALRFRTIANSVLGERKKP